MAASIYNYLLFYSRAVLFVTGRRLHVITRHHRIGLFSFSCRAFDTMLVIGCFLLVSQNSFDKVG